MNLISTNIRELAKASGVSVGTVFNVLNYPEKVKQSKKEKVLQAMKELNYIHPMVPDKRQQTKTIGLIISNITNPLYPPVIKAVEEVLDQHGYSMILGNTEKKMDKELKYIQMLEERDVDGVIIVSASETSNCNHIYSLKEKGVPIILINRSTEDPTINQIVIDTFRGGYSATKHLIKLNHKRIAFLSASKQSGSDNAFARRFKGYLWALEHYGVKFDGNLVFEGSGQIDDYFNLGYELAQEMYEKFGKLQLPSAAFIANDAMALGAIKFFYRKGIKVPEDLSIVGFNNQFFAEYYDQGLTTVNFPIYEAGKMAAEKILEEIQGIRVEPVKVVLPCELVERSTTKLLD